MHMPVAVTRGELTLKQERFCQAFMEYGNQSKAYRTAYEVENMGPRSIAVAASRLMDDPQVARRIEELKDQARRRAEVTNDRVVAEYSKLAFQDIRKAFDVEGNLLPIQEWDDDTAAA